MTSAAKTILVCQAAGPNVGVTIDIGHSTFGGEAPADSLMLVAAHKLPYYIHTNDYNGKWDWDLMAGTYNLWTYIEFLYYLQEFEYEGWITSDTSPVRQDAVETFAFNVRFANRIWDWLDSIDRDLVRSSLEKHEFMTILKHFEPSLLVPAGRK